MAISGGHAPDPYMDKGASSSLVQVVPGFMLGHGSQRALGMAAAFPFGPGMRVRQAFSVQTTSTGWERFAFPGKTNFRFDRRIHSQFTRCGASVREATSLTGR